MNRLVREHYPVSKLPEDLREGLDSRENVTVTVEVEQPVLGDDDRESVLKLGLFSQHRHVARSRFTTIEEIDAHVRGLRDEWDRPGR